MKTCLAFHFPALEIGQNDSEIPDLEFENHGFLENQVFLPTEQAETCPKIYALIYHSTHNCPSFFGWKENLIFKDTVIFKILSLGFPGHFDRF